MKDPGFVRWELKEEDKQKAIDILKKLRMTIHKEKDAYENLQRKIDILISNLYSAKAINGTLPAHISDGKTDDIYLEIRNVELTTELTKKIVSSLINDLSDIFIFYR